MNEITVADFRCFHDRQTARLAPLTLLVGENSTGKTSFLALVRMLWDIAFQERIPDFKEPPFDLGSFDEIAHHRGGRGGRAAEFSAGFAVNRASPRGRPAKLATGSLRFEFTLRRDGSGAIPSKRRIERGDTWAESRIWPQGDVSWKVGTANGMWQVDASDIGVLPWHQSASDWEGVQRELPPLAYILRTFGRFATADPESVQSPDGNGGGQPSDEDLNDIRQLGFLTRPSRARPFPNAPVRSRPRRTYDPAQAIPDPEGEYVPLLLASAARRDTKSWKSLKQSIEAFGRESGLFDEIQIKILGGKLEGPFQLQVRKLGKRSKGPRRNIIDVGYGVSQVLPVVTELLRPNGPQMFLLQQPEVHLHPSAQAALGGLFCAVAGRRGRQIIVETHSDHLIDRIRMDLRDGKTKLKPHDVSILYFQRRNLAVTIHSLGWDKEGNLIARRGRIPSGYRQFFRTETRRSLGL